jgi:hypothetical protein
MLRGEQGFSKCPQGSPPTLSKEEFSFPVRTIVGQAVVTQPVTRNAILFYVCDKGNSLYSNYLKNENVEVLLKLWVDNQQSH